MTTSKNLSPSEKVTVEYLPKIRMVVEQYLRAIYPNRPEEEWEDRFMMDSDYAEKTFQQIVEKGNKTPGEALEAVKSLFPVRANTVAP